MRQRWHGGAASGVWSIGVVEAELQFAIAVGECRFDRRAADRQADERAVAFIHRYQRQADEQEAQQQRQAVLVVESGEEHHEEQRERHQAGTRRQDIDASRVQRQRRMILALARSRPGRDGALERARGLNGDRDCADERIGDLAAALGGFALERDQPMCGNGGNTV